MIQTVDKIQAILPYLARGDAKDAQFPDSKGEFWALCPFHNDKHVGNFSVSENGYNCFSCGAQGSLDDLAAHFGVTFNGNGNGKTRFDFQNIVARYVYQDANGRELYQVWRDANKEFLPMTNGKAGYPNTRVLYHLPEVTTAQTVFLVEGEKSCDAVRRLGLIATCIPGGANGKWFDSYTAALTGKAVIILPDNDDPGRNFAQRAARELTGKAANITIADIPGLAPKQDIEDFIKQGHGREDILALNAQPAQHGGAREGAGRPAKQRLSIDDYGALFEELGYTLALNTLDDSIECNGSPMADVDLAALLAKVHEYSTQNNYAIEIQHAQRCVSLHAQKRAYNPILAYFDNLPAWDGVDHIGAISQYFRDKQGVFARWFELWIIGAVARAYDAKYQNPVLVLLGAQNLGKSYFARWLCPIPDRFYQGAILPEDKDNRLLLTNNLVWEVSELPATTRKSDIDSLKSFLTLERVKLRKAYGYMPLDKPARCSFIATTNDGAFLTDQTGNRRFLVCDLEEINFLYCAEDLDQLWAQAKALYEQGDGWKMTPEERVYQREQNEGHVVSNPLGEWFDAHITITGNQNDKVTFEAIWSMMSLSVPQSQYKAAAMSMAAWAREHNVTKKRVSPQPAYYSGVVLT